ncbi:MFS transporter [Falsiroseomonas sp.]|jgi:MFS family permease|uniref:MFS transporter n=1 Tax=Falsiroseomonas sp. TaxID=2870721 RepID=UPI003F70A246
MLRVAIGLGVAQTIAWACTYYLPAVIAVAVAESHGVSRTLVVAAFSAALLVAGLCAPRVGRAIEAGGGRNLLAVSALVIALGLALLGLLPGLWGWTIGWLVLGLGMAMGLYEAAFATLGRLFGQQARRGITTVTLFAGFASTIGFPVGAALLPFLGWRGLCLAYAAVHVLVVLPIYWFTVPPGVPAAATAAARPRPDAAALAWARRAFLLLAAFFILRSIISAVFGVHLIALLEALGLGIAVAVGIAAAVGAAQVGGRLLEFTLGAGTHPLKVARLGALLLPAGVLALLLAGPVAALPFALAYGASNGILTISRGTVPLALFGAEGYAVLMGRMAMPVLVAQALAPTLATPLVETLPAMAVFGMAGLMALAALGCLMLVAPRPAS